MPIWTLLIPVLRAASLADSYSATNVPSIRYWQTGFALLLKEYCIEGEFSANGHKENDLNLVEGTIAMARADYTQYSSTLAKQSYNSGGTQFFIMTTNDHTSLSGYYTGFGKVIEGMDVVKKIAEVKVKKAENSEETGNTEESVPKKDVKITSVTVDTFGVDYGFPKTEEPFNYMNWLYSQYGMSN